MDPQIWLLVLRLLVFVCGVAIGWNFMFRVVYTNGRKQKEKAIVSTHPPTCCKKQASGTLRSKLEQNVRLVLKKNYPMLKNVDQLEKEIVRLRHVWKELEPKLRERYPRLARDAFIFPPSELGICSLLVKFWKAEKNTTGDTGETIVRAVRERLEDTARFRDQYCLADFYLPNMAQATLLHGTNCNAGAYYGDCGVRDRENLPVLIGRLGLIKGFTYHPANHIRACMFAVERTLGQLLASINRGECARASYLLDLSKLKFAPDYERYWAEMPSSAAAALSRKITAELGREVNSVGAHLPGHANCSIGLQTLKEGMRMLKHHYPELLKQVFFYNPSRLFKFFYRIFSLWVDKETRNKFVMVVPGKEQEVLWPKISPEQLPVEFGGQGQKLDGDRFMTKVIATYDAAAAKKEF